MSRKEVVKVIKKFYDKGYRDGYEDACNLIGKVISDLNDSVRG